MNTCAGCKYYSTCGDEERTSPCKGYEEEEYEEDYDWHNNERESEWEFYHNSLLRY